MTITQTTATGAQHVDILEFIDESVRMLQEQGIEPRFVVAGPAAYELLCQAIGRRFGRSSGTFESYQWLSIVLDPFREGEVCVLPAPPELAGGVRAEER